MCMFFFSFVFRSYCSYSQFTCSTGHFLRHSWPIQFYIIWRKKLNWNKIKERERNWMNKMLFTSNFMIIIYRLIAITISQTFQMRSGLFVNLIKHSALYYEYYYWRKPCDQKWLWTKCVSAKKNPDGTILVEDANKVLGWASMSSFLVMLEIQVVLPNYFSWEIVDATHTHTHTTNSLTYKQLILSCWSYVYNSSVWFFWCVSLFIRAPFSLCAC